MSESSDQVNLALRESGIALPLPPPPADEALDPNRAPDMVAVELPRPGRGLDDFAKDVGAIARTNGVYRRDRVAVTINRENSSIEPMDYDRWKTYAAKLCFVYKARREQLQDGTTFWKKMKETMNMETARGSLKADQFLDQQRRLAKLNTVRQPVMRRTGPKAGTIELLPVGYDDESEIYTMPGDVVIDETWTVDKAKTFLMELHKEFPFANKGADGLSRGLAVHIAGMLALYAPSLQPETAKRMNFVYTTNKPRSGKSLLVEITVTAVMGRCSARTIPDSAQEFLKVLDTAALQATPYLFLDEVTGNVSNRDLNAFMTAQYWTARTFNLQRDFSAPKVTICYLAGNNLTLQSDMEGRTLQCELYIEEANVRDRRIDHVMSADQIANSPALRVDILSALWALVRHWDATGRYRDADGKSMVKNLKNGFEAWSEIYGGIVAAAGLGDPLAPPGKDESTDTENDDMHVLVEKLSMPLGYPADDVTAGGEPVRVFNYTFEEAIECCLDAGCFTWIIDGKWRVEKAEGHEAKKWYEPTPRASAIMGKMLSSRYGGTLFRLPDGRHVRFGHRGKNRQRKYTVQLEHLPAIWPPTSPPVS